MHKHSHLQSLRCSESQTPSPLANINGGISREIRTRQNSQSAFCRFTPGETPKRRRKKNCPYYEQQWLRRRKRRDRNLFALFIGNVTLWLAANSERGAQTSVRATAVVGVCTRWTGARNDWIVKGKQVTLECVGGVWARKCQFFSHLRFTRFACNM